MRVEQCQDYVMCVFGWFENGMIVAFFQQFPFRILLASFTHTLTAMQDKWYGTDSSNSA